MLLSYRFILRYPLGVDAADLEADGDDEKLPTAAQLARKRAADEIKDIAELREERKRYRSALKRKHGEEDSKEESEETEEGDEASAGGEAGDSSSDDGSTAEDGEPRNPRKARKFVADDKKKKAKKRNIPQKEEEVEEEPTSKKAKSDSDKAGSVEGECH